MSSGAELGGSCGLSNWDEFLAVGPEVIQGITTKPPRQSTGVVSFENEHYSVGENMEEREKKLIWREKRSWEVDVGPRGIADSQEPICMVVRSAGRCLLFSTSKSK
jgi:hypothetical protein